MSKKNDPKGSSPFPLMGTICNAQRVLDSFRPISVDQILQDIRTGVYAHQVLNIRQYRLEKDYEHAQLYADALPIIYPGVECPDAYPDKPSMLNGLVVVRMSYFDVRDAIEAMRHLRAWTFVKGFYTNAYGQIIVYVWLGRDYTDVNELMQRREVALDCMNTALHLVHFDCRQRMVRGVMAAYDPQCFCRPDSELDPFKFFFDF